MACLSLMRPYSPIPAGYFLLLMYMVDAKLFNHFSFKGWKESSSCEQRLDKTSTSYIFTNVRCFIKSDLKRSLIWLHWEKGAFLNLKPRIIIKYHQYHQYHHKRSEILIYPFTKIRVFVIVAEKQVQVCFLRYPPRWQHENMLLS